MWIPILLVAVIYVYYKLYNTYSYWKKRGVPNPKICILFGNLRESLILKKSLGQIYDEIYRQYPSSPYVGYYKIRKPGVLIRDPELIKEVLAKNFHSFQANDLTIDEKKDPLVARNPFFVQGEKWKKYRNQLTPAFTSKQIKAVYPLMEAVCNTLNSHLKETECSGHCIEAKDLCEKYTMDVVATCVVGLEANSFLSLNSKFRTMAQKIISPSFLTNIKLLLQFAFPALAQLLQIQFIPDDAADYFRQVVEQTMAYRKANNVTRGDFLDMMQELKQKLQDEGFSNEDVAAHCIGFFVDGFESSSIVLSFVLYELGANPSLQNKLKMEIDDVLGKHGGKFTYDSIQEMAYLNQFISESLRMHPPGMFLGKLSTQQVTLPSPDGKNPEVTIEPGTPVVISIYSLHYDPKYHPNPDKFDPERFSEENKNNIVKYTYMPFGEGPRTCLGQRFALAQIKTAVVHLVTEYEIRVNEKTHTPLQIDSTYMLLAAKGGLWLDFHRRSKNSS